MRVARPADVEFMCTYCGTKIWRHSNMGKPYPGKCPRRNGDQPHRWVVNKRIK